MYLNDIVSTQKRGEARGITSICSAHPWVLKTALHMGGKVLIESTCNQVNQFGGYTGMTPANFVDFVRVIAKENDFPFENIILGGDHLGPNVWQYEPSDSAMQKSAVMIKDYVQAGFVKIHLDCSMQLADDKGEMLDPEIAARRAASLAKMAEASRIEGHLPPLYVIGTEVPIPGGAQEKEEGVQITRVIDAQQAIESTQDAFVREGLESAWERVIALVVQPGVEFGDDFVLRYDPKKAQHLARCIENQPMIFEAHSTDYQSRESLRALVHDHFAILKVGPALTFAFREAVFSLAMMENELFPEDRRSNLIKVLDDVMIQNPGHWQKHFQGSPERISFARKYSLSDRIRYYWTHPGVQAAFIKLLENMNKNPLPVSLINQFAPGQYEKFRSCNIDIIPEMIIVEKIGEVLKDYSYACGSELER